MFFYVRYGFNSLVPYRSVFQNTFQNTLKSFARKTTMHAKPPNILVYAKTESIRIGLVESLRTIVQSNTYTVYPITESQARNRAWPDSTALLLVHGPIEQGLTDVFLDFFLNGGKLFGICCMEILQKIQSLKSCEGDIQFPKFLGNIQSAREIHIDVLSHSGTASSLTIVKSTGKAVFSTKKLTNVSASDSKPNLRLYKDVLSSQLDIHVATLNCNETPDSEMGFLMGSDKCKTDFLAQVNDLSDASDVLKTGKISLQFFSEPLSPIIPTSVLKPISLNHVPIDFSASDYYNNLKTYTFGRLALYLPVVSSSMEIVSNARLTHGFVVIPRRQTNGIGRSNNQWLSPKGCAMFSIQLHVPLYSPLGQRLPLAQHLVAIAIVKAIRESGPGFDQLDVRLKWPNDIYANGVTKIGGCITNSQVQSTEAIVNIGCALNLSNSTPTVCLDDLIHDINSRMGTNLPNLRYEQILALIFNEIERLFNKVQCEDLHCLYELYYRYWLHQDKLVTVKNEEGSEVTGRIKSIDEYGYLLVELDNHVKPICIHPDGNSFDMMKGLIIPKNF
ncbi:biotin--protein ligase [Malaya genurostris]|uniref:biotin--protein ligase n=1 Tax=Malaya genurostris TaxID=325434 RepID=UPI0026F3C3D0|nr:biotin--protein ligase [Malaya genurostris]